MNKNVIITALLVAVTYQPVSSVSFFSSGTTESFGDSLQRAIRTTMGLSALAGVAATALVIGGYKYLTREKVWAERNCIKFKKRGLFSSEEGSVCFATPEERADAEKVMKTNRNGLARLKEIAHIKRTCPSAVCTMRPMTEVEARKFDQEMAATFQEHDRAVRELLKRTGIFY